MLSRKWQIPPEAESGELEDSGGEIQLCHADVINSPSFFRHISLHNVSFITSNGFCRFIIWLGWS